MYCVQRQSKNGKKALGILVLVIQIVLCVAIALLLVYNVCVLVQRAKGNRMPSILGYSFAVVVSGSMEPEIAVGDVVVIKSQEEYVRGDVVTFYDSSMDDYVTHRIILVADDGTYLTKGDANDTDDKMAVPKAAVVGKVVRVWRGAGTAITFLRSPAGMAVLIGSAVIGWVLLEVLGRLCGRKKKQDNEQIDAKETIEIEQKD